MLRASLRWAVAGIVALGLLPVLGVEPVRGVPVSRDATGTAAAGTVPVRVRVPAELTVPSVSRSRSPSPSPTFLHVINVAAAAGCLALAQGDLVRLLDWLDPAASPRIVMTPGRGPVD